MISEGGRQITYRELDVLQKQYAAFMDSERPFVFLICDTSVESILIYISCIQNRILVMVLDNKLSEEKVADLIYAYQPDYIWDFGKQYFWEEYILEKSFQDLCLYHKTQNRVSVNKDLALVLLTSESVGSKKGVRISYQNIESNMRSIAKSLELSEKDVAMVMLPMCYTYGLSVIHSNLSVGGTLLVPKSQIFTARFWEFFKLIMELLSVELERLVWLDEEHIALLAGNAVIHLDVKRGRILEQYQITKNIFWNKDARDL